jgi:hypothetical protein
MWMVCYIIEGVNILPADHIQNLQHIIALFNYYAYYTVQHASVSSRFKVEHYYLFVKINGIILLENTNNSLAYCDCCSCREK